MSTLQEHFQNIHMDWTIVGLPQIAKIETGNEGTKQPEKILGSVTPILPSMPVVLTRVSWTHHLEILKPNENPSIGVLFCKSKNDEVVEIAMSRQISPTLVSVYETKFLDKKLLPSLLHDWSEEGAQQHNKDL